MPDDLAVDRGDVGDQRVELGLRPAGPGPTTASPSSVSGAGGAVDEDDAQLPLEPGDVGRDVGLHGVQGAGGGGEPAVLGDGDEGVRAGGGPSRIE